jgi:hypothetical protein
MLANESKILRIKLKGLIIIMFCQKHFSDILEVSFSRGDTIPKFHSILHTKTQLCISTWCRIIVIRRLLG